MSASPAQSIPTPGQTRPPSVEPQPGRISIPSNRERPPTPPPTALPKSQAAAVESPTSALTADENTEIPDAPDPEPVSTARKSPVTKRKPAARPAAAGAKRQKTQPASGEDDNVEGAEESALAEDVASGDDSADAEFQPEKPTKPKPARKKADRKPKDPNAPVKPRAPVKPKDPNAPKPPRKPRKKRGESPDNSEGITIVESEVKMKDLCSDNLTGRKSKRFVELAEMDWTEHVRKQQIALRELDERRKRGEAPQEETLEQRLERLANQAGPVATHAAPQLRMVDGQIVLDEESLRVDRHLRDQVEEEGMEIVEENVNTRMVNSNTWSKRERADRWDEYSTQRFYEGLNMFGTDFDMLSRLFPGRSRRQVKNKFNCEERRNPDKINIALRTKLPVDMKEYSEITDKEFADPELLEQELEALRQEHEKEAEQQKEHAKDMERERQSQANAAMHAEGFGAPVVETKRQKNKKQKELNKKQEQVLEMSIEDYEAERLRQQEEDEW